MSSGPSEPDAGKSRRGLIIVAIVLVVVVALGVVAAIAAFVLFFGSDAPDAPTLDNAIKVLLPSSAP